LHRNYVGALERGEINPTIRTLHRLMGVVGQFGSGLDPGGVVTSGRDV
jgi:transcriptional regulator with XRE-family HTH domain